MPRTPQSVSRATNPLLFAPGRACAGRRGAKNRRMWARLAFLAIACTLAGCGDSERAATSTGERTGTVSAEATAALTPTFVGSDRCAECHAEQTADWRGSHHDRAMEVPSESSVEADFDGRTLEVHGERWRFDREGDDWVVGLSVAGAEEERLEVTATFHRSEHL